MQTANPQIEVFQEFAAAFAALSLPFDMAERFAAAHYLPIPKQLYFHKAARECDLKDGPIDVGLGGARGGAKSHGTLAQLALDDCQRQDGLKCLWLRQVGVAGKESLEDLIPRVVRVRHEYVSSPIPTIRFPNRSRIIVGHFNSESDVSRYLGLEYDVIATEEATQLTASKNQQIGTCLRTSKPNWRPRRYYTTNPGGVGHAWFKKMFIDPARKGLESMTRFIFSTFRDNPYLNPDYVTMLNRLTGWLRRAWRDGDWDIAAGQFFSTWDYDRHVCDPFPVLLHWPMWACLDYGFTHPTACYFLTENDGTVYVTDEHVANKQLVEYHARELHSILERRGRTVAMLRDFVAGHDCFAQRGDQSGKTIADQYAEYGIYLNRANIDRVSRAARLLKLLGDVDAGIEPRIKIFSTCTRLIECIPSLQHDPKRPEDVLKVDADEEGEGGDDPYDAVGMGLQVTQSEGAYI